MTGTVRPRAVILGALLGLGICAVTPYNNAWLDATPLAGGHFPLAPFVLTFLSALLFAATARLTGRPPLLSGMELMAMWALMTVVSGIAYTGLARTFLHNLSVPLYFANDENGWAAALHPLLPGSWYPSDSEAVSQLWHGVKNGRDLGFFEVLRQVPWHVWAGPLLVWGIFIALSYFVLLCIVNIFSTQWVLNERVNFPLLRAPQVMAEYYDEGRFGSLLMDRFLLTGFLLAASLQLINGLNFYYPSVPRLDTLVLMRSYFPKFGLLSGYYKLKIYIYPAFIGFAFLTTRQVSFSFWFFFLLGGLLYGALGVMGLQIPESELGVMFGPFISRPEEAQMIGAAVVFFLFVLWLGRFHLSDTVRVAFGRPPRHSPGGGDSDRAEWFSLRISFWGALIGTAGLVGWAAWFGMPVVPALLLVASFLVIMLVVSRVVCQGGLPYMTLSAAPIDGLLGFFGSKFFGPQGVLMGVVMQKALFLDVRESLMPSLFHAAKVSERAKGRGLFFWVMALMIFAGAAVSLAAMLALAHKFGLRDLDMDWATRTTMTMYDNVKRLAEAPVNESGAREWVMIFAAVGAAVMFALTACYQRFHWWPIHPIGYLAAYSSAMRILWFSFFVGWLCNHLCLHYGGTALFRRVRLFFIGLILGDFLMGGLWAAVGVYTGYSYLVLPD